MAGFCVGAKGKPTELPSGIISMGARVYDPYTGTFLQTDPVQGGGDNAYGYTDGDPVNEIDLNGTTSVSAGGCAGSRAAVDTCLAAKSRAQARAVEQANAAQRRFSAAVNRGAANYANTVFGQGGNPEDAYNAFENASYRNELVEGAGAPTGGNGTTRIVYTVFTDGDPEQEAQDWYAAISQGGTGEGPAGYPGVASDTPDGGWAGFRTAAQTSSDSPVVEWQEPGGPLISVHFQ